MDQFIGETDYWNKGIGSEFLQMMASYLKTSKGADYVEIGHNGIREKYKRQGYGHKQLEEALRRIKEYEGLKTKEGG